MCVGVRVLVCLHVHMHLYRLICAMQAQTLDQSLYGYVFAG